MIGRSRAFLVAIVSVASLLLPLVAEAQSLAELRDRGVSAYERLPDVVTRNDAALFARSVTFLYAYEQRAYRQDDRPSARLMGAMDWLYQKMDAFETGKGDTPYPPRYRRTEKLRSKGMAKFWKARGSIPDGDDRIWDVQAFISASANLYAYLQVTGSPDERAEEAFGWLQEKQRRNEFVTSGTKGDQIGPADPDAWIPAGDKPPLNPAGTEDRDANEANSKDTLSDELKERMRREMRDNLRDNPINELVNEANFQGVWETNRGTLRLHQFGGYAVGDFADEGVVLGKIQGNQLRGTFTAGKEVGVFTVKLTDDGQFKGLRGMHGEALDQRWNGTRTAAQVTELKNFTRDGSSTRLRDNERQVYDGVYESQHGTIKLIARDMLLIGDYAEKGIVAGVWNGNRFEGLFTNHGRPGWFRWAFFSKTGDFRSGSWGWIGGGRTGGGWTLREVDETTPSLDNMYDDVPSGALE